MVVDAMEVELVRLFVVDIGEHPAQVGEAKLGQHHDVREARVLGGVLGRGQPQQLHEAAEQ
jgi:hypothetical protein